MREFIEYVMSWLWCGAEDAKAAGLTNHGRLYGLPAWVRDEGDMVSGCPKVPILRLYTAACDVAFDMCSYFIGEDTVLVSPLHVGKPIE